MSSGTPQIEITDEDIDNLLIDFFGDPVKKRPDLKDLIPRSTDPDFIMLDPVDVFWKGKGQCPKCADGTRPDSMPGGGFECPKCKWRNG